MVAPLVWLGFGTAISLVMSACGEENTPETHYSPDAGEDNLPPQGEDAGVEPPPDHRMMVDTMETPAMPEDKEERTTTKQPPLPDDAPDGAKSLDSGYMFVDAENPERPARVIHYSFQATHPDDEATASLLDEGQQAYVREVLAIYEERFNLVFEEVTQSSENLPPIIHFQVNDLPAPTIGRGGYPI